MPTILNKIWNLSATPKDRLVYTISVFFILLPTIFAFTLQLGHFSEIQFRIIFGLVLSLVLTYSGFFITGALLTVAPHQYALSASQKFLDPLAMGGNFLSFSFLSIGALVIGLAIDRYIGKRFVPVSVGKFAVYIIIVIVPFVFLTKPVHIQVLVKANEELSPPASIGGIKPAYQTGRWWDNIAKVETEPTRRQLEKDLKKTFSPFGSKIAVGHVGLPHEYSVHFRGLLAYGWPMTLKIVLQNNFVSQVYGLSMSWSSDQFSAKNWEPCSAESIYKDLSRALQQPGNVCALYQIVPLVNLPAEISSLQNIQILDLTNSALSALPPEIKELRNLKSLKIQSNQLTQLIPEIGSLENLERLNLSINKLTIITPAIGNLKNLKYLHIEQNDLMELPMEIGNLTNLEVLSVSQNRLRGMPDSIRNLTRLREFYYDFNDLLGSEKKKIDSIYQEIKASQRKTLR